MKKVIIVFCLLIIIFLAAYFRIILPDKWLHGETLRLPTVDAYYQARFAQVVNNNDGVLPPIDPYFSISGDYRIDKAPIVWPWLISQVAHVVSPLNPNDAIDIACYYLPPILGILCVIGVFLIMALLFNAWAGLAAALLMATMGGEFLARSIAGSADYHAWEVFLLVSFMLSIIASVKWHEVKSGLISLIFAVVSGLIIAVYMKSWAGAMYLFMILLFTYILYLLLLSFKKEAPSGTLFGIPCVSISASVLFYLILTQLTGTFIDNNILLLSAFFLIAVIVATIMQSLFVSRNNRWGFLVSIVALGVVGIIAAFTLFQNTYYEYIINILKPLFSWASNSHTSEERPILLFGNEFSLQVLWGNFTASIFLCIIGIGVLIKRILKSDINRHTLFNLIFILVGTIGMLMGTLAMVRFAYYFAVFVACLSGMLIYIIVRVSMGYLQDNVRKMKWWDKLGDVMLLLLILSLIFIPNIMISNQFAHPLEGSITGGWEQAMLWLRANSDEPFENKDYYYANYNSNILSANYSVLSWWDYGYWIMYVGHRVPVCNPGSAGRVESAAFMVSNDNDGALRMLQKLKSRYVVIDYQTVTGKFTAMPTYAYNDYAAESRVLAGLSEKQPEYMGLYSFKDANQGIQRVTIFYPEYYRAMSVRLFNFNGQATKSPGCPIIIYTENDGVRLIQKIVDSPSYAEAMKYTDSNTLAVGEKYALGGTDPFLPCVDLPEVKGIVPIQGFGGVDLSNMSQAVKQTFEVKIFEYTGDF